MQKSYKATKKLSFITYLESTLSGMTSSPILCLSLCFFLCFLFDFERDVSFLSLSSSAEMSTLKSPKEKCYKHLKNTGIIKYFNKMAWYYLLLVQQTLVLFD